MDAISPAAFIVLCLLGVIWLALLLGFIFVVQQFFDRFDASMRGTDFTDSGYPLWKGDK